MVLVRETAIADWQALRDIRLLALRDAPEAFASTYAREAAFGEAEWRQRSTRDGSFIAFLPEAGPTGLAGGYQARRARSSLSPCSSGRGPAAGASARP